VNDGAIARGAMSDAPGLSGAPTSTAPSIAVSERAIGDQRSRAVTRTVVAVSAPSDTAPSKTPGSSRTPPGGRSLSGAAHAV